MFGVRAEALPWQPKSGPASSAMSHRMFGLAGVLSADRAASGVNSRTAKSVIIRIFIVGFLF